MRIGLICTNLFNIDAKNKTGTGIFSYILIKHLAKLKDKNHKISVFASGKSRLPFKVESINSSPSSENEKVVSNNKHIMFELALISKAFRMQKKFDVYHVNIGDGDLVMPFATFVKKPILITLHNIINENFTRKYFSLFKNIKNVFFIPASNYQKKILPNLNYTKTIHHGIDTRQFSFNKKGGKNIMWAGRFIPGKGPDTSIRLAKTIKHKIKLFGIIKNGYENWFEQEVKKQIQTKKDYSLISLNYNYDRHRLVKHYQKSKVFILPTLLEEAFGLVFIESMACGTPVVTFARGSAPEVIEDGKTGFLVNVSNDDIRGDWIIKKTGFAGLCEAVEKIYSLSPDEYQSMRKFCRNHVIKNFSAEKMAQKYLEMYKKVVGLYNIKSPFSRGFL